MSADPNPASKPLRGVSTFVLFSHGFRPFFLGAGVLGAVSVPLWLAVYSGRIALPGQGVSLAWHMHEMLFGYLGAAMAGFLLTAIPNWAGRQPIIGAGLAGLFVLWLLGRVAIFSPIEGMACDVFTILFPIALTMVVWQQIFAGKNYRNFPVCILVATFAGGQVMFWAGFEIIGLRLGFAAAALLLMLIGGRITPNFTRNWLKQQGRSDDPAPFGAVDKGALLSGFLAMVCWTVIPDHGVTGILFAVAAALNVWRLSRWCGYSTLSEPLLLALHVGYGWLCVSFALFALSILAPELVTEQQALHALGAGAIGQMTLAVMIRASLGHSGRALAADPATSLALVLVFLGAALRIAAGWPPDAFFLLYASTTLWSGGFAVFVVHYFPVLCLGAR